MVTFQALAYIEGNLIKHAHLELCLRNPYILERVLNGTVLSNSAAGKFAPMQVKKQPKQGRTSTAKERK